MTPLTDDVTHPAAPRPRARWLSGGVLLLALGAVLGGAWAWREARGPEIARWRVQEPPERRPAVSFELPGVDGRMVRLEELRGRIVLLTFWATWCSPCREEMPALEALARDLARRGLVVVGVNYQESGEAVATFARDHRVSFPLLLDASGEVTRQRGLTGLPVTQLIDRSGRLVGTAVGYRDWTSPEARAYLERLLDARS